MYWTGLHVERALVPEPIGYLQHPMCPLPTSYPPFTREIYHKRAGRMSRGITLGRTYGWSKNSDMVGDC